MLKKARAVWLSVVMIALVLAFSVVPAKPASAHNVCGSRYTCINVNHSGMKVVWASVYLVGSPCGVGCDVRWTYQGYYSVNGVGKKVGPSFNYQDACDRFSCSNRFNINYTYPRGAWIVAGAYDKYGGSFGTVYHYF